jgi:uncharacterized protein (DUF362 family)
VSTIYFSESFDRRDFTAKTLEIFKESLEKAGRIFIKPNIVSYEPYPTTTHPEVLETILKQLSNREVIVGDAPAIDAGRSDKIIQESPLKRVCDHYGVRLVNLYSEKMKTIKSSRGYKIKISTLPLTCDYIISLPVLKTHNMLGLSGALKNQFGYLSKQDRLLMHSKIKNIDKGIAEANVAIPTNLFIMDAIETMIKGQECRHGGCPEKLGFMMAGTDPVALDCFGLQLLRKVDSNFKDREQRSRRYIDQAESYGVGTENYVTVQIARTR